MSTIELHLFRIKFIKPKQRLLFNNNWTPANIFKSALEEKPSIEFRQDHIWHIGNLQTLDNSGGSFAVGRTTKTTVAKYDLETGNFIEEYFEESPYTLCLYDLNIGLIAIAKKSKLAPTTNGIAKKLNKLLSASKSVRENDINIKIDIISDPEGFIQKIKSSYSLKKFTSHFTGPNPFDADELFQKPLSVYCQAINGDKGRVLVEGDSLDTDVAISIAKSSASTGNEASANIVAYHGGTVKKINLKGDPVKKSYKEEKFKMEVALNEMRLEYQRVRG
jgi:hypothetical protein